MMMLRGGTPSSSAVLFCSEAMKSGLAMSAGRMGTPPVGTTAMAHETKVGVPGVCVGVMLCVPVKEVEGVMDGVGVCVGVMEDEGVMDAVGV